MKASIKTLIAIATLALSPAVFAQAYNEAPMPQAQQLPQQQAQQNPAGAQTPQWAAPNSAGMGKSRAQVYGELVEAQRDGQIAYLNRTLYAHH
jgi:hypothetical protein